MKLSCEVCHLVTYIERHHIQSKSKGGNNKPYNIARLCPNCHNLVHRGDIVLEGKFLTTAGHVLLWHRAGEEAFTSSKPAVHIY